MPTYTNNGSKLKLIPDVNGALQQVKPGASIETYEYQSDSDLTETAATPHYNPVLARSSVSSTGAADPQTVTITPATCRSIKIWKVTGGNVSIYNYTPHNTPALAVLRAGDSFEFSPDKKVKQLYLIFSAAGTCEVVQSRESID